MTPNSTFHLCSTKLVNQNDVLSFASESAQQSYFSSTVLKTYNDFTYIKHDGIVKVPEVVESVLHSNYCYFNNPYYGNKVFYAYVRNIKYISPRCTEIHIEIDAFMTFQHELKYGQCFVEREHVAKSDDVVGRHTLPEPIPTGRLYYNEIDIDHKSYSDVGIIIGVKYDLDNEVCESTVLDNAVFGCGLYFSGITSYMNLVKKLEEVQSGNVLFVQAIPLKDGHTPLTAANGKIIGVYDPTGVSYTVNCSTDITISKGNNLNGYTPKNNKLLTYPYTFCAVTSGKGDVMEYAYENFYGENENTARFTIYAETSNNPSLVCVPREYENKNLNYDKKVMTDVFPSVPYANDNTEYYNTAKAFQASENKIQNFNTAYGSISSMAGASNVGGLVMSGVGAVGNVINTQMTQELNRAKLEDSYNRNARTYNGTSCGGMLFQKAEFHFRFYNACITNEYAKIADDYLTRFGYSCLETKVPNINNRPNFNYVKTIGANIYGNVPNEYLSIIKSAFDSGITIWHSASTMYDYTNN